ncbi:MAG TPA: hypothetical protein VFN78_07190 [Ktedonobacterales bacterium]|nr:hypothetical protein [Ktedonobacterales bacterium]
MVSLWRRRPDWSEIPWTRLPPLGAFAGVVALFLLRDALVFGSPLASGYGLMNQQNYPQITHGLYSLDSVQRNLVAAFLDFPRVSFASPFSITPTINLVGERMGMSVFVTTPNFFLYAKSHRVSPLRVALHLMIALCVIQALLFCATGYYQFGARYLFDAYPFAFLLLALNERRIDCRFVACGLVGLVIDALGARQYWT